MSSLIVVPSKIALCEADLQSLLAMFGEPHSQRLHFIFISHQQAVLDSVRRKITGPGPGVQHAERLIYKNRGSAKAFIDGVRTDYPRVAVLGTSENDMQLAANVKGLLFSCEWQEPDDKVKKYGVPVPSTDELCKLLMILLHQQFWFCRYGSERFTLLCLYRANDLPRLTPDSTEREVVVQFRRVLKEAAENLKDELLVYFLAAIAFTPELRTVQDWAAMPSSTANSLGPTVPSFARHARYLVGARNRAGGQGGEQDTPILVRSQSVTSSHKRLEGERVQDGPGYHFPSMTIHPNYVIG